MLARCVVAVSAALGVAALLAGAVPAGRGDLDPSFGAGGKVRTDFGGSEIGVAVAVQRDRRVVVAGDEGDPGPDDFLLVRYTANGKLDPTFGAGGRVATDFGSSDDLARDVEVQIDGKIVVVGGSSRSAAGASADPDTEASGAADVEEARSRRQPTGCVPSVTCCLRSSTATPATRPARTDLAPRSGFLQAAKTRGRL